jgi:hypothetical protein
MAPQSVRRHAIAEAKQRSRWSVMGCVTLELLHASEGTLSCWSRLHLQSLAPTPVSRRVDARQPVVKIIAESLSQHNKKHVVSTSLTWIKVCINGLICIVITLIGPSSDDIKRLMIHTYIILTLYPRPDLVEAFQIFLRDAHVLPKLFSYE